MKLSLNTLACWPSFIPLFTPLTALSFLPLNGGLWTQGREYSACQVLSITSQQGWQGEKRPNERKAGDEVTGRTNRLGVPRAWGEEDFLSPDPTGPPSVPNNTDTSQRGVDQAPVHAASRRSSTWEAWREIRIPLSWEQRLTPATKLVVLK